MATKTGPDRPIRRVDKDSDQYEREFRAGRAGLPPFPSWTYGEVQLFHNATPKRCQTRYTLKVGATTEGDFDRLRAATRRHFCVTRWAALSEPTRFVRNLAPSRKRHDTQLSEAERAVVDDLVTCARRLNAGRAEHQPSTLLGLISVRHHGSGTIRSVGQFALVAWLASGAAWMPVVFLTHPDADDASLHLEATRLADHQAGAAAFYGVHYSEAYRNHLAGLRRLAVARDTRTVEVTV